VFLPATFRLTNHACVVYGRLSRPYRLANVLRADHLTDYNVNLILRGGYGVRKHVLSVAEHIFEHGQSSLGDAASPPDLVEEMTDHNACHPSVYRVSGRARDTQLTLLSGGRD
jgi:hypothetical protein